MKPIFQELQEHMEDRENLEKMEVIKETKNI